MANLILTSDCQRNCVYCFAQENNNSGISFTWENFITVTNFIATGPKLINLLGGEPTLHKDFIKMLEYLIINDFKIQVFTNGMLSDKKLNELMSLLSRTVLRDNQLYFAVNVNSESYRADGETELQNNFFDTIGKLSYPSFTIHEKNTNLLFLVDIIEKYYIDPTIRLGLSMPIIGGKNKYLPLSLYENAAKSIIDLAENSAGITIAFDCGFPLCMFSAEEIAKLNSNKENDFMFVCGQPMDIYPDLNMINCFPLSNVYKTNISKFANIEDAYHHLEEGLMVPVGIYGKKCIECAFFRTACFGGCKGFYKLEKNNEWEKLNNLSGGDSNSTEN